MQLMRMENSFTPNCCSLVMTHKVIEFLSVYGADPNRRCMRQ